MTPFGRKWRIKALANISCAMLIKHADPDGQDLEHRRKARFILAQRIFRPSAFGDVLDQTDHDSDRPVLRVARLSRTAIVLNRRAVGSANSTLKGFPVLYVSIGQSLRQRRRSSGSRVERHCLGRHVCTRRASPWNARARSEAMNVPRRRLDSQVPASAASSASRSRVSLRFN